MKQSFLFFVCPPPNPRASALLWTVDVESDENLRDGETAGTISLCEFTLHVAVGTQSSMQAAFKLRKSLKVQYREM